MLPDYPDLKSHFEAMFSRFVKARVKEKLGPTFRKMRQQRIFEGNRSSIRRASGSQDTSAFEETKVGLQFDFEEIPELSVRDVLNRLDRMAEDTVHYLADNFDISWRHGAGSRTRN
jgi:hypothetical protein